MDSVKVVIIIAITSVVAGIAVASFYVRALDLGSQDSLIEPLPDIVKNFTDVSPKISLLNETDYNYTIEAPSVNERGGVIWYGTQSRDSFDALGHLSNYFHISIEARHRPISNLIGASLVYVGPPLGINQFSESEEAELVNYVTNGGKLILAVDNDYAQCDYYSPCALDITRKHFGFGFSGNIESGTVIPAQGKSNHPLWTEPNHITSLNEWAEDGFVSTILDPTNVKVLARTSGTTRTPGSIYLVQDGAVIVINENPDFGGGKVLGGGYDMIVDYGRFRVFENVIHFMLEG